MNKEKMKEIENKIKILEFKVEKIIGKLNLEYSNLEYGYEWVDEMKEELEELLKELGVRKK